MEYDKQIIDKIILSLFESDKVLRKFLSDQSETESGNNFLRYLANQWFQDSEKTDKAHDRLIELVREASPTTSSPGSSKIVSLAQLLDHELDISVNALVGKVNALANKIGIDGTNATAFSRMRRQKQIASTKTNRNHLYALTAWLTKYKPGLKLTYSYLSQLTGGQVEATSEDRVGVCALFHFTGLRTSLEPVTWLHDELKRKTGASAGGRPARVRGHALSSVMVEFPLTVRLEEHPPVTSYGPLVRDAIAAAYDISVSWRLSDVYETNANLVISIIAGELEENADVCQTLVEANLPMEAIIRFNEFTRLVARVVDLKVGFCQEPREILQNTDKSMSCFWISHSWNFVYWDVTDSLTEQGALPVNAHDDQPERTPVLPLQVFSLNKQGDKQYTAISRLYDAPHDSLLAMEIAKVLLFRGLLFQASEIVRMVLAVNSTHISARALRVFILYNIALDPNMNQRQADAIYDRICHEEGLLKQRICLDEDASIEFGLGHFALAIEDVRRFRKRHSNRTNIEKDNPERTIVRVQQKLERAEKCFWDGVAANSSGYRAHYWLLLVKSYRRLYRGKIARQIMNGVDIYELPIDLHDLCWQSAEEVFTSTGWLEVTSDQADKQKAYLQLWKFMDEIVVVYESTVLLRNFLPEIYWAFATLYWDFSPYIDKTVVRKTLNILTKLKGCLKNIPDNEWLYSIARGHRELQHKADFFRRVEFVIQKIEGLSLDNPHELKRKANQIKLSFFFTFNKNS